MMRLNPLMAAATLAFGLGLSGHAVQAACFESGVGCTDDHAIPKSILATLSCDSLWTVRNTIYHERGYCFRTARARAVFSNEGCISSNTSALPFNSYERTNISRIVSVETAKGCR